MKIIGLTEEKFYASLSELNPEQDPWAQITEEDIGSTFNARIQSVAEYGHFIRLDNGLDGLLLLENALRTMRKTRKSEYKSPDCVQNAEQLK